MLVTHIVLAGDAAIVAESSHAPTESEDAIRVYLGEALVVTMPAALAEDLADALLNVETVFMWPAAQ